MLTRPLLLALLLFTLTACCCPCNPKQLTPLPPPITLEEQSRRLTEWSALLPNIKARTVLTGVRLDYRDDQGQNKSVNAEGLLQIRQHIEGSAAAPVHAPADVLLLGSTFDQPAFEAGRNAKDWWFAIRLDTKKAWIGDATKPVNFASLTSGDSATILRADLVPDLLALSDLAAGSQVSQPRTSVMPATFLLMLVDDMPGSNHLFVMQERTSSGFAGGGMAVRNISIQREIIIDRRSGHVTEVRLYTPEGILAVRSLLSDYVPVTYDPGVEKPATIPQFPRKITVTYPSQFLTVALEFDTITITKNFRPVVFETPDFKEEGLRVIPAE